MKDIIQEKFGYLAHEIEMCNISFRIALKLNDVLLHRKDLYAKCYNDEFLVYSDRAHKITTFVALGKIYDTDADAVSIHGMVKWATENQTLFSISELRKRKLEVIPEKLADEFLERVKTPTADDFKNLNRLKSDLTKKYVENVRPLRNKVYAHRENILMETIAQLYEGISDALILELAEGANGIYHSIWMSFHNGGLFQPELAQVSRKIEVEKSTERFLERFALG